MPNSFFDDDDTEWDGYPFPYVSPLPGTTNTVATWSSNTAMPNNSTPPSPPSVHGWLYATGAQTGSPTPNHEVQFNDELSWEYKGSSRKAKDADEVFHNRKLNTILRFRDGKKAGLIGLEIECEGQNLFNSPFKWWGCHADGSLREYKGHPPVEYVLKNPLDPPELKKAFDYLDGKLKEAGSVVVSSSRTSVHVHVNCQDLTVKELYNFILLWIVFEEILVEWSGPERAGNLFCLRAKDSDFYVTMLERALKEQSLKHWTEEHRYSACNIASVPKFGSLEFRSMRGTVDFELISNWINILITLKEKSEDYKDPTEIVEEFMNVGPLPFFRKIFSNSHLRSLLEGTPQLSAKLWTGLRLMRDVAYSIEWTPPKKKETSEQEQQSKLEEQKSTNQPPRDGEFVQVVWGDLITMRPVRHIRNGSWYIKKSRLHAPDRIDLGDSPLCNLFYVDDLPGSGSHFIPLFWCTDEYRQTIVYGGQEEQPLVPAHTLPIGSTSDWLDDGDDSDSEPIEETHDEDYDDDEEETN